MNVRRFLSGTMLFGMLSATMWAGVIQDPAMGVEPGSFSDPIGAGVNFVPINGGGVFGFFNPTDSFITSLTFETLLQTGLTTDQLTGVFSCNDQNTTVSPNPFFLNCSIGYDPFTGTLTISFFGVNPVNPLDSPFDPEVGTHVGIPPLAPACDPPAPAACSTRGHFEITLNDNFSLNPDATGGWNPDTSPDIFPANITFDTTTVGLDAPEPSTGILLGLPLLALCLWGRRFRLPNPNSRERS